jgi:hypothetical protein
MIFFRCWNVHFLFVDRYFLATNTTINFTIQKRKTRPSNRHERLESRWTTRHPYQSNRQPYPLPIVRMGEISVENIYISGTILKPASKNETPERSYSRRRSKTDLQGFIHSWRIWISFIATNPTNKSQFGHYVGTTALEAILLESQQHLPLADVTSWKCNDHKYWWFNSYITGEEWRRGPLDRAFLGRHVSEVVEHAKDCKEAVASLD